jgi:hypothetical protein
VKKFQVNEDETAWAGFLVDADAQASMPLLGRRAQRAKSHADEAIVEEAWSKNRTIVTSNRRDFLPQPAAALRAREDVDGRVKRMENRKRETGNRKPVIGSLRDFRAEAPRD